MILSVIFKEHFFKYLFQCIKLQFAHSAFVKIALRDAFTRNRGQGYEAPSQVFADSRLPFAYSRDAGPYLEG